MTPQQARELTRLNKERKQHKLLEENGLPHTHEAVLNALKKVKEAAERGEKEVFLNFYGGKVTERTNFFGTPIGIYNTTSEFIEMCMLTDKLMYTLCEMGYHARLSSQDQKGRQIEIRWFGLDEKV